MRQTITAALIAAAIATLATYNLAGAREVQTTRVVQVKDYSTLNELRAVRRQLEKTHKTLVTICSQGPHELGGPYC